MRMPARSVTKAKAPTFAAVLNRPMGALDHNLNRRAGEATTERRFCLAMLGASRYSEWGLQVLARRIARILLALGCRPAVAAVLGSALVACAEPKAQPSSSPPSQSASAAREQGENSEFAPLTASPRAMAEALVANDERTLSNACGEADAALLEVASQLALQQSERGAELDSDTLTYALRRAGAPYVRPRAWLFDGTSGEVET